MRALRIVSFLLTGLVASALLAPAALQAQNVEIKPGQKVKRDKYVITKEEIAEHPDLVNGYDIVRTLRNQWLRMTRTSGRALGSTESGDGRDKLGKGCILDPAGCTASSPGGGPVPHESGSPYAESGASTNSAGQAAPVLYLDEIKQQGLDELKNLKPADIFEMRYMTGTEASGRFGAGHENGAILVKLRKPGNG